MDQIIYREMTPIEAQAVCDLVRRVFNEFVAPQYEKEGIDEFFRFASPGAMEARMPAGGFVLVASKAHTLVGMLEFTPPNRIAMLFVSLLHQCIAKTLLERAIGRVRTTTPNVSKLTVHSSNYAEPIYRKMGFHRVGNVTTDHGITYIPMERDI